MRILCNLLIGIPILGLLVGSVLLIVQAFVPSATLLGDWNVFGNMVTWLVSATPGLESLIRRDFVVELPAGAHIMILSTLSAIIMVPLGVVLYKLRR